MLLATKRADKLQALMCRYSNYRRYSVSGVKIHSLIKNNGSICQRKGLVGMVTRVEVQFQSSSFIVIIRM